jgi:hypothetical protein
MPEGWNSQKTISDGEKAAALAGHVKARLQRFINNPFSFSYADLLDLSDLCYDDDVSDGIKSRISHCMKSGNPPIYYPKFIGQDLPITLSSQAQRRAKYSKGDMSSYGWLKGAEQLKGEPHWEVADDWFTLYFDYGGGLLIKGPRRTGKTLLATNKIALKYIQQPATFRTKKMAPEQTHLYKHTISGVFAEEIYSKKFEALKIDWKEYYHYHSSLNSQLQTACRIKEESLKMQQKYKVKHMKHPLVFDLIDEGTTSRGRQQTMSDKVQQQMYIAAIAGHLGIFVAEIHPFDSETKWVRESITHKYEFISRGTLIASVNKAGESRWDIKKIFGFKSLEQSIDDGDDYLKYRPYAPEAFRIDVDVIKMLDNINQQMEESQKDGGKPLDEIEQWTKNREWLEKNILEEGVNAFGINYGQMVHAVSAIQISMEEYNELMKDTEGFKPIKITQQTWETILSESPWPIKRNTLGESIVQARGVLKGYNRTKRLEEEAKKEVLELIRRKSGYKFDDEGNLVE